MDKLISVVPSSADQLSLEPPALDILVLRGEIAELGGAIRQLQRSGLDSASAQLLITRKRAELARGVGMSDEPWQ